MTSVRAALRPDTATLDDLATFARVVVDSADLEPWALIIADLGATLPREELLWLINLYNTFDAFDSAWHVLARWPTPTAWLTADDRAALGLYPCTQERRGLRGGKSVFRTLEYARAAGPEQDTWLTLPLTGRPRPDHRRLMDHLRRIWGVGRQSAFEWAEFLAKCAGYRVEAADAVLWESEGPRRSLQRLYGWDNPDEGWLNRAADHCREHLADQGVSLSWEDFETVICDFNVMRDGRYYPGRHLAALREEIDGIGDEEGRAMLEASWARVIPEPWAGIAPGIDKANLPVYRNTGTILAAP